MRSGETPAFVFALAFLVPEKRCQAPKLRKPNPHNNIHVAYEFHPNRYTSYRA
jgi:hypothetical protein